MGRTLARPTPNARRPRRREIAVSTIDSKKFHMAERGAWRGSAGRLPTQYAAWWSGLRQGSVRLAVPFGRPGTTMAAGLRSGSSLVSRTGARSALNGERMEPRAAYAGNAAPPSALRVAALALVAGAATGVLTFVGQRYLPGQWNVLVNSGAIWLVPVFLVASRMGSARWGAAAGLATLAATLLGYYGAAMLSGIPESPFFLGLWCAVALVAGPLYGAAGSWWRDARRTRRVTAVALLGGVFVAEGSYLIVALHYHGSGVGMIAAGVLITVALARDRRDRLYALLALPAVALLAFAAHQVIAWLATAPAR